MSIRGRLNDPVDDSAYQQRKGIKAPPCCCLLRDTGMSWRGSVGIRAAYAEVLNRGKQTYPCSFALHGADEMPTRRSLRGVGRSNN